LNRVSSAESDKKKNNDIMTFAKKDTRNLK